MWDAEKERNADFAMLRLKKRVLIIALIHSFRLSIYYRSIIFPVIRLTFP